ncbi:MAG: MFS transporter [Candidatus Binatia bacterium]
MTTENSGSIWTRAFALLCLAQFLGYAQHFMLAPVLPLYVTDLGGSPFVVGMVLASFAVTSVLIRPLVGHWADRWSEAGVLISGLLFQGASIFLCLLPRIEAVMLANGLRGIGWAGLNTGGYSLLALTAPESRRGEASGLYSGVQSAATILFPAFALWLLAVPFGGFAVVFTVTAALSVIGAGAGALMARYSPRVIRAPHLEASRPWWREVFHFVEPEILLPSLLLLWLNLSLPSMTNFIVLYAREIGIENFAVYFIVSGLTSLLARPGLGRLSDKIGRARSMAAGFSLQVLALFLMTLVSSLPGVLVAGILYMLGNAIGSSTTLALALERADPRRRGKAMATFSVAYPLSYGVGSVLTGGTVEVAGYLGMFLILAALQAAGLFFARMNRQSMTSRAN